MFRGSQSDAPKAEGSELAAAKLEDENLPVFPYFPPARRILMALSMVPLSAVFQRHCIILTDDPLADPDGTESFFAKPLSVCDIYRGPPTGQDRLNTTRSFWLGEPASDGEEELGVTLIVQHASGEPAALLYFPNDQHLVKVQDDDEDDW